MEKRDMLTCRTEMVLFYNTFVALKSQSPQTVGLDPMGVMKGERVLFKA